LKKINLKYLKGDINHEKFTGTAGYQK